jgi:hypothetical protein
MMASMSGVVHQVDRSERVEGSGRLTDPVGGSGFVGGAEQ